MSVAITNTILAIGRGLDLSSIERLLLLAVAFRADDAGVCGWRQKAIEEQTGAEHRSATNAWRKLRAVGLISAKGVAINLDVLAKIKREYSSLFDGENEKGKRETHSLKRETDSLSDGEGKKGKRETDSLKKGNTFPFHNKDKDKEYTLSLSPAESIRQHNQLHSPCGPGEYRGNGAYVVPNYSEGQKAFLRAYGKQPADAMLFRSVFDDAVRQGVSPEVLTRCADAYVQDMLDSGDGTRFQSVPEKWISDSRYRDHLRDANRQIAEEHAYSQQRQIGGAAVADSEEIAAWKESLGL